ERNAPARLHYAPGHERPDAGDAKQLIVRRTLHVHREQLRVGERPGELGVVRVRQVPCIIEYQFITREVVAPDEVIRLVQSMLTNLGCALRVLQRSVPDGAEGTEVRMVQPAQTVQLRCLCNQGTVRVTGGAHNELGRPPRNATRAEGVARASVILGVSCGKHSPPGAMQRYERSAQLLLRCDLLQRLAARC